MKLKSCKKIYTIKSLKFADPIVVSCVARNLLKLNVIDSNEKNLKNSPEITWVRDAAFEEAKLKGMLQGKIEGKLEAKKEVAKTLKGMGISIDNISETTGLSKNEIESL